ncbi:hypothetical protein [Parafrankia sp. BMG5.11]|uniref:hypothetical protein n=1 Tax=Parafrankia sp. BMG5.11 TaxID=222540 RepID=UPI0010388F63|nr:hypothetical protein [Parafrankia sp. BMG5.11]TCJ36859.1 hypothetical protein E0504_21520 [Parafrankia sp. BMG5.11]
MSAHLHLDAARHRASAVLDRPVVLVGLLLLDEQGEPARIVGPFASETAARQWARQDGITAFRVLPAQVPRVRM